MSRALVYTALIAALTATTPGIPHASLHARQQQLPPVTYVCPMAEHSDVVEDAPGKKCPRCGMDLVPAIIDLAWSCPVHPVVMTERAGRCPLDKRELVQVTISRYWTCPDKPKDRLTAPGTCANGKPRTMVREHRAHGDHNPKHGGQLFMAADKWHHIEAAYPRAGVVRVFVYDNFTQPMAVREFSGRAVTREDFDAVTATTREREAFPLKRARDGKSLEARIGTRPLPARVTIKFKFDRTAPEERFDFAFDVFTTEPASLPPVTRTPPAPPPAAASTNPPAQAPASFQAPPPPLPAMTAPLTGFDPLGIYQPLPLEPGELLKLLIQREQEVTAHIHAGQLGAVYVPALQAKEVALALEAHVAGLPNRQQLQATTAIKHIVLIAWELDAYGDLGDAQKVARAHAAFAAAIKELQEAYASR